jgi:hypothetical protein
MGSLSALHPWRDDFSPAPEGDSGKDAQGRTTADDSDTGLAAFGMLNPLLAAFIHVSSELAFHP